MRRLVSPRRRTVTNPPSSTVATLQLVRHDSSLLEELAEFQRQRKRPALAVLGLSRVESHFAAGEVDLAPLEGEYLAVDAPARNVGELDDRLRLRG